MRLIICAVLVVACTKKNPAASCVDGVCSDPSFPTCDVDGAIDGDPNACIALSCMPGEFLACDGNNVLTCNTAGSGFDSNACDTGCSVDQNGCNGCTPNTSRCVGSTVETCGSDGKVASTEPCALSCSDAPAPHCAYLEPRYLPDICDLPATASSLEISASETVDTLAPTTCNGGLIDQTSGASICVLRYAALTIDSGATLRAIHSLDNRTSPLLAIVTDGDISIHGALDIGAAGPLSGPGGGVIGSVGGATNHNGGGGAGFQTAGAAGGSAGSGGTDGGANNGGGALPDPALLVTLIGGPAAGGGGGGGATLVSCRGSVVIDGTVTAGGGGGNGGTQDLHGLLFGGDGGGAGGYVVLQGLDVLVSGRVFANGGGGGAGFADVANGQAGADGLASTNQASGGVPVNAEGAGGNGAAATAQASVGKKTLSTTNTAGGGGGGLGFFQSYTPAGVTPSLTPSQASPAFQPNATVNTR